MRLPAPLIVAKAMKEMTVPDLPDDVAKHLKDPNSLVKSFTVTDDFTTGAGLMLPEYSNKFLRKVLEVPTLLDRNSGVRVHQMRAPTKNIDRIGFGSRILKPLTEATAISTSAKPTATQLVLSTTEYGAKIPISFTLLEDILEGKMNGGQSPLQSPFVETVQELLAPRLALDIEDIIINSDTSGSDPDLDEFDGALALASGVYDHLGGDLDDLLFKETIKKLPNAYLQRLGQMRFFLGPRTSLEIRSMFSSRATSMGDSALSFGPVMQNLPVSGVPTYAVAKMPEALGDDEDRGKLLLFEPSNLIVGFWREILLMSDVNIDTREITFVVTLRIGTQYEDPDGVAAAEEYRVAAA